MTSYSQFLDRVKEVDCLIDLIPEKPNSGNVNQINALCRASIVLLCSHLEGLLQDIMEEYIEEVNQLSIGFKSMPLELYVQHLLKGQIQKNNFDNIVSIFTELRALENSNSIIKLNKHNFSQTEGNPTPDNINKLFNIIGEKNVLDTLNLEILNLETKEIKVPFLREDEKVELVKRTSLPTLVDIVDQFLTEKRNGSGHKNREVGFYNDVNTLLKYRNEIAHGNKSFRISTVDVIELKDKISALVEALTKKAILKIDELKKNGASSSTAMV